MVRGGYPVAPGRLSGSIPHALRVAIHQPHYLPWLRYFEKVARADVFVLLDDIQFSKNGWQNRNRVRTYTGTTLLTVPVHAALGAPINAVTIDNRAPWARKHARTLVESYRRAPHWDRCAPLLDAVYGKHWDSLAELNAAMLTLLLEVLGIQTPVVRASTLQVTGQATQRLVNLIRAVGGDTYYSGAYALDAYLDAATLERAGIALELQHWECPHYPQVHGDFIPDLAIIDLLANHGPDALTILTRGTS